MTLCTKNGRKAGEHLRIFAQLSMKSFPGTLIRIGDCDVVLAQLGEPLLQEWDAALK